MNVLLGITGGISAYKAADLIIGLQKTGHEVKVIMTDNATKFITPLTIATLSKNPVATSMWVDRSNVEHIDLAKWAEAFVVYPATANIIAKFAHGIADDTLSTVYLALSKDISKFIFPAANTNMLNHGATQDNLSLIRLRDGVSTSETRETVLACGDVGKGGLISPRDAVEGFNGKVSLDSLIS